MDPALWMDVFRHHKGKKHFVSKRLEAYADVWENEEPTILDSRWDTISSSVNRTVREMRRNPNSSNPNAKTGRNGVQVYSPSTVQNPPFGIESTLQTDFTTSSSSVGLLSVDLSAQTQRTEYHPKPKSPITRLSCSWIPPEQTIGSEDGYQDPDKSVFRTSIVSDTINEQNTSSFTAQYSKHAERVTPKKTHYRKPRRFDIPALSPRLFKDKDDRKGRKAEKTIGNQAGKNIIPNTLWKKLDLDNKEFPAIRSFVRECREYFSKAEDEREPIQVFVPDNGSQDHPHPSEENGSLTTGSDVHSDGYDLQVLESSDLVSPVAPYGDSPTFCSSVSCRSLSNIPVRALWSDVAGDLGESLSLNGDSSGVYKLHHHTTELKEEDDTHPKGESTPDLENQNNELPEVALLVEERDLSLCKANLDSRDGWESSGPCSTSNFEAVQNAQDMKAPNTLGDRSDEPPFSVYETVPGEPISTRDVAFTSARPLEVDADREQVKFEQDNRGRTDLGSDTAMYENTEEGIKISVRKLAIEDPELEHRWLYIELSHPAAGIHKTDLVEVGLLRKGSKECMVSEHKFPPSEDNSFFIRKEHLHTIYGPVTVNLMSWNHRDSKDTLLEQANIDLTQEGVANCRLWLTLGTHQLEIMKQRLQLVRTPHD